MFNLWNKKNRLVRWLNGWTSPQIFYQRSERCSFLLTALTLLFLIAGVIAALYLAPTDYKQGDGFRMMYIHVPAAIFSMLIYSVMAICAAIHLIWKIKLADCVAYSSASLGASMTVLALITGAIWGKPMWGTWWVWDARLTSELILLFLYLSYLAVYRALPDRKTASFAANVFLIIGLIDIPIIHFSVDWWFTLHQGSSLSLFSKSTIAPTMLYPLLLMLLGFGLFSLNLIFSKVRLEILEREQHTRWVQEWINADHKFI